MPFEGVFSEEIRDWFWENEEAVWNKDEKIIEKFSQIMKNKLKKKMHLKCAVGSMHTWRILFI